MKNTIINKFRRLEDRAYEYGYTDIRFYENNARKAYSEIEERTNVKVSGFAYDEDFVMTVGLVSMVIDNKGIMEDDKAYEILFMCADVLTTICDKSDMIEWINGKLSITYETGYVPFLFEDYTDKLASYDTLMILLLDMVITMGYCGDVKCLVYHTINNKVIYHEFTKKDDNTVKAESTLTEGMKKEYSELYDKCDNGEISCKKYMNKLYDVAESKGGENNG